MKKANPNTILIYGICMIAFIMAVMYLGILDLQAQRPKGGTVAKVMQTVEEYEDLLFIDYDPDLNMVTLEVKGYMAKGTDHACLTFGKAIYRIAKIDPFMTIYLKGDWIPSRENPISFTTARALASGY